MKKRNVIFILIIMMVIVTGLVGIKLYQDKETKQNNDIAKETDIYDEETINEIKNEINATADTDMYQIEEEYDGRKILQIKPSIQFQTVLAGIIKNGQPLEDEIQELLKKQPTNSGIWIAKQTRETFLKLLQDNEITSATINEEGYLSINEESDKQEIKKLKEVIQSDNLIIIDVSGTCYTRDDLSGEIVEYPFEKMDPDQAVDVYQEGKEKIIEVTKNEKKKLSSQEIFADILINL